MRSRQTFSGRADSRPKTLRSHRSQAFQQKRKLPDRRAKRSQVLGRSNHSSARQTRSARTADTEHLPLAPKTRIALKVNGTTKMIDVAPWTTLLDTLREYLNLPGTKKGCDHGQCGACTVLVDGKRILSCLTLAIMKDGAQITTIEGLAKGDALHPLQQAFIEHDAFQCGYCTPGQICSAVGLIAEGKAKTPDDIRELMSGNICRCGAYSNILAAIQEVMPPYKAKGNR